MPKENIFGCVYGSYGSFVCLSFLIIMLCISNKLGHALRLGRSLTKVFVDGIILELSDVWILLKLSAGMGERDS